MAAKIAIDGLPFPCIHLSGRLKVSGKDVPFLFHSFYKQKSRRNIMADNKKPQREEAPSDLCSHSGI